MTVELVAYLSVGTIAMFLSMLVGQRHRRSISQWEIPIAAVLLTVIGVLGAKLMFFIENGGWRGTSFFGALFFAPPIMALSALLLHTKVSGLLDLCAPAECVMLAVLKVQCFLAGCCGGRCLWYTKNGTMVTFPSQIVEFCNALLLMVVLLRLMRRDTMHGRIYPMYLLLYGITRFCLNLLRETTPFLLGLPAGNFWSLIAIFIGGVWLWLTRRPKGDKNEEHKEAAS